MSFYQNTAEHIHTETCYKENLTCALARIAELESQLYDMKIVMAKSQIALREAGAMLDKAETHLDKALNPPQKK